MNELDGFDEFVKLAQRSQKDGKTIKYLMELAGIQEDPRLPVFANKHETKVNFDDKE